MECNSLGGAFVTKDGLLSPRQSRGNFWECSLLCSGEFLLFFPAALVFRKRNIGCSSIALREAMLESVHPQVLRSGVVGKDSFPKSPRVLSCVPSGDMLAAPRRAWSPSVEGILFETSALSEASLALVGEASLLFKDNPALQQPSSGWVRDRARRGSLQKKQPEDEDEDVLVEFRHLRHRPPAALPRGCSSQGATATTTASSLPLKSCLRVAGARSRASFCKVEWRAEVLTALYRSLEPPSQSILFVTLRAA